jgi:hypothetical protein
MDTEWLSLYSDDLCWTAEKPGFDSRRGISNISLLHIVQMKSKPFRAFFPINTGFCLLRDEEVGQVMNGLIISQLPHMS